MRSHLVERILSTQGQLTHFFHYLSLLYCHGTVSVLTVYFRDVFLKKSNSPGVVMA